MLPYGNAIWENIKSSLNAMIEEHGAENVEMLSKIVK